MNLEKTMFMLNKLRVDLFGKKEPFQRSSVINTQKLDYYYFNFIENPKRLNRLIAGFDHAGIPLNRAYIDVQNAPFHYYPISIGQYALAVFHSFLKTGNKEKKYHFLRIAEWFYTNRIEDEDLGVYWLTHVAKPESKVDKPWKSAFSQSRAISLLLRAWQITSNDKYLQSAKLALVPFTKDISEGGVTANLKDGHPFYEEYVAAEPTMVLDGHIFSLFGLHEFSRAVSPAIDKQNHELSQRLFADGIESMLYYLPEFDMQYWLRFNLCRMSHYPQTDPCTVGYLRLVTTQLKVLYQLTNNSRINEWYQKIRTYDHPANILKMYFEKYRALKKLNRV